MVPVAMTINVSAAPRLFAPIAAPTEADDHEREGTDPDKEEIGSGGRAHPNLRARSVRALSGNVSESNPFSQSADVAAG